MIGFFLGAFVLGMILEIISMIRSRSQKRRPPTILYK